MMNLKQVRESVARAEKSTPGPWKSDTSSPEDCVVWHNDGTFLGNVGGDRMVAVAPVGAALMFDVDVNNAEFIAASRADIPALAETVEALYLALKEKCHGHANCVCGGCKLLRQLEEGL